jgi:hypothetical protein
MNKKQILTTAVVTALSTGIAFFSINSVLAAASPGASPAAASITSIKPTEANPAAAKPKTATTAAKRELLKVSENAMHTMRNVHNARLAIFDGQPEQAQTFVDAAVVRIGATLKDAEKYAVDVKEPMDDDAYVPYDTSLTVLDTFKPNKEDVKHIATANEYLHQGKKQQAMEALGLVDVRFATTIRLVPVKLAKQHIDAAEKLVSEHKYYEANLALKALEDAVIIETFSIDKTPTPEKKK